MTKFKFTELRNKNNKVSLVQNEKAVGKKKKKRKSCRDLLYKIVLIVNSIVLYT